MKTEYKLIDSVQPGDLVWRYDRAAVLTGPYIITRWTQHFAGGQRWWMVNTTTGEEVSCFMNQLRKAYVTEE